MTAGFLGFILSKCLVGFGAGPFHSILINFLDPFFIGLYLSLAFAVIGSKLRPVTPEESAYRDKLLVLPQGERAAREYQIDRRYGWAPHRHGGPYNPVFAADLGSALQRPDLTGSHLRREEEYPPFAGCPAEEGPWMAVARLPGMCAEAEPNMLILAIYSVLPFRGGKRAEARARGNSAQSNKIKKFWRSLS